MIITRKILDITEGASLFPVQLNNGDKYDSCADLLVNNTPLWSSNVVNTRATNGYAGGKLAKGLYYGIKGKRANGTEVIKLFSHDVDITKIKSESEIPEKAWRLPSSQANPNHQYQFYLEFVQVHGGGGSYGGAGWNWSHACLTILNESSDFTRLLKLLDYGEIIEVNLH